MAATDPKYLNEGATAFAAANWSDAVGIDATNGMVCNRPTGAGGIQTTLADWGGVATIKYIDFIGDFTGPVGGTGGAFILAGSGTTTYTTTAGTTGSGVPISRVRWWPKSGDLYYTALVTCNVFQINNGTAFIQGGDFLSIHCEASGFVQFSSTATSGASGEWIMGGRGSFVDTHASDTVLSAVYTSGTHTLKRGWVAVEVLAGATLIIDAAALAGTTVNIKGGTVILLNSGAITNLNGYSGTLDLSRLARAVAVTNSKLCPDLTIKPSSLIDYGTKTIIGSGPKTA